MTTPARIDLRHGRPLRRRHLAWEVRWLTVELAGVATALYFLEFAHPRWLWNGFVAFAVVLTLSLVVRLRHYGGTADGSAAPRA